MKTVFRQPDRAELTAIALEAVKGDDRDLPEADKRGREKISEGGAIEPGTPVFLGHEHEFQMIGPGRGKGWALLAWVEDGVNFYGTFHETQFTTTKPEAPDDREGKPVAEDVKPKDAKAEDEEVNALLANEDVK